MSTKTVKKLIGGILAAAAVFGGCFAGLSMAERKEARQQDLQVQQGTTALMYSDVVMDLQTEQAWIEKMP